MQFVHKTYQFLCNKCTFKANIEGYLEIILSGDLMARGPNVSCVMTCLLRKQAGQVKLNLYLEWTGQSTKYKEPLINRCIDCEKTNAT